MGCVVSLTSRPGKCVSVLASFGHGQRFGFKISFYILVRSSLADLHLHMYKAREGGAEVYLPLGRGPSRRAQHGRK